MTHVRRGPGAILFDVANYLSLTLFALTILYPFWTTVLLSFSPLEEATTLGFHFWIQDWTTAAYEFALSEYGRVDIAYRNSIIRLVLGTALTLVVTFLAAYPLSKRRIPGRKLMTIYVLVTMFFNGGLIPTYLLIRGIGLIDSLWALILPHVAMGYYIVILRNYLMGIDDAYEEAALMDGANYLQILVRVMVPLSKPVVATIALWTAVFHWNSWFDALIYLNSESKIVLQLMLRRLLQDIQRMMEGMNDFMDDRALVLPSEAVKAAVTILTIGPIILGYPFLQKYFMKGIFVGSLKG